jgi:hypothetical protein
MSHSRRRLSRFAAALAITAPIAGVVSISSAQAALVQVSACDGAALSQPFAPWADTDSYKLAPGGDFESGLAGWSLSGGAAQLGGSEPFAAAGSSGSYSLSLPTGASAQSPYTCVNAAYPTFRFFARTGGAASILVQAVYPSTTGTVAIPVGVVSLNGDWAPTLPMATGSALPAAMNGGTAQVALRFTALTGSSQIDDVFVDPVGRGG